MVEGVLRVAAGAGRAYLRLLGLTVRHRCEGLEGVARARDGGAVVLAFWHNRLLGPAIPYRGRGMGAVISQSRDGEFLSRVLVSFGYVPLRGSSSRGGAQALRAVLRHLRGGRDVAFTPDGPRGPRYTVHPGVAQAARQAGVPVVPVGVAISRKIVFSSWDRFQLPLPWARVLLWHGPPLRFERGRPVEEAAEEIRAALHQATEQAESRLGVFSP